MSWVSVQDDVIGKKLRELAKELKTTQEEALGVLVSLWLWGRNNANKEGEIVRADKDDILEAFSIKLVGKLGGTKIVDALVKTRWLDEPEPGVLFIHDWARWQEQWYKAMERREKDAKRKAQSRMAGKDADGNGDTGKDGPGDLPFGDEPGDPPAGEPKQEKYPKDFETFWTAYPRKVDKGMAYNKYKARRRDGYSAEELLAAANNYADECRRKKTEKEYIKHPKTFLGDATPFIEYLPKNQDDGSGGEEAPAGNPFAEYGGE